ncbi:MAG: response regulator transcription factor [Opitutaceae bacterium]|nr:response regulator transcription factor [Opitutaceae bacterium]
MKILITDDHAVVRQGLKQILAEEFTRAEFGEAASAQEAIEKVWKENWDVVVLDITMPGRSGLEVLKEIKKSRPKLPVLMLSMHPEDQFAVRLLKIGASGYMTKESAPDELVGAVKKVMAGGRYVSPSLAEKMASYLAVDVQTPPHERLSDREFLVLRQIGSGKTATAIAKELGLSVKTISTYRMRILEKMSMLNNAELTHYAIQNQLV